jgi:hypothetical protein
MEADLTMGAYLNRALGRKGEAGITMVAVLVSFTIVVSVVLGSMALISNSTKHSRHQQDSDLALAAAKSGLNDLLTMLRGDPSYLDGITGPTSPYCSDDAEAGNPATGGPEGDYFAEKCGWPANKAVGWKELDGSRQAFHYAIRDYVPIRQDVEVVVTGRSGNVYRTLKGYLARQSTEQWLYFSDYELADPNDYATYTTWVDDPAESVYGRSQLTSEGCGGNYASNADVTQLKELGYKWQMNGDSKVRRMYKKNGLDYPCAEPDFVGDRLLGRVHSNDTIRATGTTFGGVLSTADPACKGATDGNECVKGSGNTFASPPVFEKTALTLPGTDDPRDAAVVNGDGCLYQGPTRIILQGQKMRVWSKYTTVQRDGCGVLTDLNGPDGAEVDIPGQDGEAVQDALVFIDQLPEDVAVKLGLKGDAIMSGGIDGEIPRGNFKGQAPTKAGDTYRYETAMRVPNKGNTRGNLYIEGEYATHLTVAAHGLVVITGDLVTDQPQDNLLGVISGSSIELYNPVLEERSAVALGAGLVWGVRHKVGRDSAWANEHSKYDADPGTFTVHAALYASTAGFGLQNWSEEGVLGTLYVYGSIAQRFRGVVGYHDDQTNQLVAGYKKNYVYNDALSQKSPLLFSPIGNGTWVITWMEQLSTDDKITD